LPRCPNATGFLSQPSSLHKGSSKHPGAVLSAPERYKKLLETQNIDTELEDGSTTTTTICNTLWYISQHTMYHIVYHIPIVQDNKIVLQ
jgi:hypothetical protein